jgi:hypothetical protein
VDWPRLWLTLAIVVLCVVFAALLRLGWRHRATRQSGFAALPAAPVLPGDQLAQPLTGVYVSTTNTGQWQDRIVVHGIGRRAKATARLYESGVMIDRAAEDPIWIPRDALLSVSTAPGVAGKVMGLADGILLITWTWSGKGVDSGFRADDPIAQAAWIDAAATLLTAQREQLDD